MIRRIRSGYHARLPYDREVIVKETVANVMAAINVR